jgi:hypothetical protein
MKVEVTGQPGSSLCIRSKGFVVGLGVLRRLTFELFGPFVARDMTVHNAIRGGELADGMQGALSKVLTSQVVDACCEKAGEVGIGDAGRGGVPVNEGGSANLVSKGNRAARLLFAIRGECGKRFKYLKSFSK